MRIAFIGGNGHHYLRGALDDPAVAISAVAVAGDGHDPEGARKLVTGLPNAARWQPAWFDDPRRMLDAFKPDLVSVGSVYGYNGDMIALALERGLPVASDKPIAGSWEQLERLRALAAADSRRVIATEFDFHSRPEFRAARDAVRAGLIGDPVLVTAQKSYRFGAGRPAWYGRRADYTGIILWVASHGIDALAFATGRRHRRVSARHGNIAQRSYTEMEDHSACLYEMEGGATGLVHADFLRPAKAPTHGDDRLRLVGSKGLIEVRDARCRLVTHDQEEQDITDRARAQVRPIHRELLAALRGESTDLYGTAWSLRMAAVLLASRDAADRGQWVDIPAP